MWLLWMLLVAFLSSGAVQGGAKQRNPYTVLELKKEATHAEVKKAYRKAALKYHPDRPCPEPTKEECTSKFIEVAEAYNILIDPDARATFDKTGWSGSSFHTGGGDSGGGDTFTFEEAFAQFQDFEKLFDAFIAGEYDAQLDMVLGAFWGTSDPAQQSFVERQMKWVAKNAIKTFGGKVKGWVDDGTIQVNVNGQQYKGSSSGSRSGRRTRLSEHEDADTLKSGGSSSGTSSGTSRRSTRNNKNKKNRAGKKKVKDEM